MTIIVSHIGSSVRFRASISLYYIGLSMDPFTLSVPDRPSDAPTGSEFLESIMDLGPTQERENAIFKHIAAGNIPDFMRKPCPVSIVERDHDLTLYVLPDYLCIGSDNDFVRTPMDGVTAQRLADFLGGFLPTRKIVNETWKDSDIQINADLLTMGPPEFPYGTDQMTTKRFGIHNQWIEKHRIAAGKPLGSLVGGHKKDVVISNLLKGHPDRLAIYGWHRKNGKPIQGPNVQASAHEILYKDYAHGIRIVLGNVLLNGQMTGLSGLMLDPELCWLVSDEGQMTILQYPT